MKKKKNLMDFMKRIITGFMKEGRPGTAHVYQSTYNRILDFMGGRPMDFAELRKPSRITCFPASFSGTAFLRICGCSVPSISGR